MDRVAYALQVTVIGLSVVMFTLFLLYAVISLFSRIFNRPAKVERNGATAPPPDQKPVVSSGAALSPRIVAAITAAVTGYMQSEGSYPGKITISLPPRPQGNTGNWALLGRKTLLERNLEYERLRRKGLREKV